MRRASRTKPFIIGITGASGVIYGTRLLEVLRDLKFETILILGDVGERIIQEEVGVDVSEVIGLATKHYKNDDLDAPVASGSYPVEAMVITPCSMKTLGGIASGYSENLLLRAADVTLKEKRPLILVPRETPLSALHLENMLKLARLGVVILPAMPGFYHKPKSVGELVDHVVGKILDMLGVEHNLFKRWGAST